MNPEYRAAVLEFNKQWEKNHKEERQRKRYQETHKEAYREKNADKSPRISKTMEGSQC